MLIAQLIVNPMMPAGVLIPNEEALPEVEAVPVATAFALPLNAADPPTGIVAVAPFTTIVIGVKVLFLYEIAVLAAIWQ